MTGEELAGKIKDEIGEDERLHAILDRIREGKATFTDSELYAAITARITAQQMQRNVLSLDKREAAFVGITRERYTDTFTVFSAVQRILDAQNGIRIRPQEPGFDTGRARKIGHSLEDQTVPDSTIERRARSATENFCMSHHDDCVKAQAEFRARAGLQSYAIREGGAKCCDWCADVSGKYPANETPQGFWGRHDNCKCSILYESKRGGRQLLRGTSKKWEQVKPGAGAGELHRMTAEQGAAVGAGELTRFTRNNSAVFEGLTKKQRRDMIKAAAQMQRDTDAARIIYDAMTEDQRTEVIQRGIQELNAVFSYDTKDNFFPSNAQRIPKLPNTFDIISHGTVTSIDFFPQDYPKNDIRSHIDAYTLSQILLGREDFQHFVADCKARGVEPSVRLLSCNTGNTNDTGNCFAQLLANELKMTVNAPTDVIYAYPDGSYEIGQMNDGEIKPFWGRKWI